MTHLDVSTEPASEIPMGTLNVAVKSKAVVLKDLEESRREKNQEMAALTQSLEHDRSKVHALTAELAAKRKVKCRSRGTGITRI